MSWVLNPKHKETTMNRNPTTTGPADALPPTRFRNQATGCSPVRAISEMQGAARSARVVECMPGAVKRAVAPAQGYPR
jgi:hypothetical protein